MTISILGVRFDDDFALQLTEVYSSEDKISRLQCLQGKMKA